ncbi:SafA/ExsA family spore coat assembly protein [Bacillus kexueae]|uniref:SafA/ExsA family spore coat assembly protein n=1 Tax=Aeribacillus kexueae TaxID=2078952 RepID=UPI00311A9E2F
MKIHIVQKGDTLWKIAQKYDVDFEQLKQMNTQLSNPDLIMPGMKIKVPTGGVPVKKEAQINYKVKKEMPKAEHPYSASKPKSNVDVEDTKADEKPSKPFVPQKPNKQQPFYPEVDVHNYYTVNMSMMPEAKKQPQLPPKPANVLPDMMKPDVDMKDTSNEQHHAYSEGEENDSMTMPYMNQMPYMPMMPAYGGQWPQNCVPVSPVMPGPGFGPMAPYGNPHGMYPTGMAPEMMEDDDFDDDGMVQGAQMSPYPQGPAPYPYQPQVAPAYGMPYNYGMVPPGCVPVSPVMPGPGFGPMPYPQQQMYNPNMVSPEMMEHGENEDNAAAAANQMPPHQPMVSPYANNCGCPPPMMPYYGAPMQQPYAPYPPQPHQGMHDYRNMYQPPQYEEEED